MKEVTQVHIARIPYNIERDAYAVMQAYLEAIGGVTTKAHRQDLLDEVESRIVEILSTRNIDRDGTITEKDVTAIREQLGEPHDFADPEAEGDAAEKSVDSEGPAPKHASDAARTFFKRKWFRDEKRGIVGGVCYGIAKMLDIDPLWVRLAFVALAFFHGFGLIVYVVLLFLVPNVKNDGDRLEMEGKPVNIKSLQWFKGEQAKAAATEIRGGWDGVRTVLSKSVLACMAVITVALGVFIAMPLLAGFTALGAVMGGMSSDILGVPLEERWYVRVAVVSLMLAILTFVVLIIGWTTDAVRTVFGKDAVKTRLAKQVRVGAGLLCLVSVVVFLATAYPTSRDAVKAYHDSNKTSVVTYPTPIRKVIVDGDVTIVVRQDSRERVEVREGFPFHKESIVALDRKDDELTIKRRAISCSLLCVENTPEVTVYMVQPQLLEVKRAARIVVNDGIVQLTVKDKSLSGESMTVSIDGKVDKAVLYAEQGKDIMADGARFEDVTVNYDDDAAYAQLGGTNVVRIEYPDKNVHPCWMQTDLPTRLGIGSFQKFIFNGKDYTAQLNDGSKIMDHEDSQCFGIQRGPQ